MADKEGLVEVLEAEAVNMAESDTVVEESHNSHHFPNSKGKIIPHSHVVKKSGNVELNDVTPDATVKKTPRKASAEKTNGEPRSDKKCTPVKSPRSTLKVSSEPNLWHKSPMMTRKNISELRHSPRMSPRDVQGNQRSPSKTANKGAKDFTTPSKSPRRARGVLNTPRSNKKTLDSLESPCRVSNDFKTPIKSPRSVRKTPSHTKSSSKTSPKSVTKGPNKILFAASPNKTLAVTPNKTIFESSIDTTVTPSKDMDRSEQFRQLTEQLMSLNKDSMQLMTNLHHPSPQERNTPAKRRPAAERSSPRKRLQANQVTPKKRYISSSIVANFQMCYANDF